MNKSQEFIIDRIKNGYCSDEFIAEEFEKTLCLRPFKVLPPNLIDLVKDDSLTLMLEGETLSGDKGTTKITLRYDPNAEFEYFTSDICTHDGTLTFLMDAIGNIINKLFELGTYNISNIPPDFKDHVWDYDYEYIIGDFVINSQVDDKYAPEDKPWMKEKQIVTLPIKWKWTKKNTKLTEGENNVK